LQKTPQRHLLCGVFRRYDWS